VTTAPVDEALGTQLKLPAGVGLLVEHVDEDSPAAKVLKKNDVLHKLGDQLLVNHQQLQALLRTHKPGDTITLTVIRDGESKEVEVTLGERSGDASDSGALINLGLSGVSDELAKAIQIVISKAGDSAGNAVKVMGPQISVMISSNISALTGAKTFTSSSSSSSSASSRVCVKSNERGTFTLTCTDGKKQFKAIGKDGKKLFDGPVNTDEELSKLSDELKKELGELEKTTKPAKKK
jgi:hypothetical protein